MKLAVEEYCLEFVPPWPQPLDDVPMVSPQKWRENKNGLVSVEFVMSSWDCGEQPAGESHNHQLYNDTGNCKEEAASDLI